MEYMIPTCSGKKIEVKQGQTIMVIDMETCRDDLVYEV